MEMKNAAGPKNRTGKMLSDDEVVWVSGGAVAAREN